MSSARSESVPSLDSGRWRKIGEILSAVIDLPLTEREQALLKLCDGDLGLVAEVGRYLEAHEQTSRWLGGRFFSFAEEEPVMAQGQAIGSYQVISELGRGGMGEVYLAQRADETYEREVAIKVIKRGMDSQEIAGRFFRERRILANLDHPGIARLLDGGSTADGRPYFVMEYIDGQRIDEFARQEALSIRARLKLFRKVCAAVSHAHRQLVVHRDLKPANILVDSRGEPKLLDFGIAKLLGSESELMETRTELRPMTLKYSSPEQLRGGVITAAVDIHALGLLLYELVVGRHPYGSESPTPEDLRHSICESEPVPPSRVAAQSSARRISRQLKGDLDAIVLKALRKDPLQRYDSVAGLDEDVRRHLDGEPVRAKKGGSWYRLSRFARRHWRPLTVVAGVLALIGFFVLSTMRQSEEVAKSAETARRTADFLIELFHGVDPTEARGEQITVREILDRGVERIETELADEPEVRAELTLAMGKVHFELGKFEAAVELLRSALSTQKAVHGERHEALLETLFSLSEASRSLGQLEEAEDYARSALETSKQVHGDQHATFARAMNHLSLALWHRGDLDSAKSYGTRALALARANEDWETVGAAQNNLGLIWIGQGDWEKAEESFSEALDSFLREFGRDHPLTVLTQNNLGSVLVRVGKGVEAELLLREVIASHRRVLGEDHPRLANSLNNFSMLLSSLKRHDEAETVLREALEIYRRSAGGQSAGEAWALHNLAVALHDQGKLDEALELIGQAENMKRKLPGDGQIDLPITLVNRADILSKLGRCESAEPLFREAIALYEESSTTPGSLLAEVKSVFGECLVRLDQLEEAENLLLQSLVVLEEELGSESRKVVQARRRVVDLYEARGQPEKARIYRERPEEG